MGMHDWARQEIQRSLERASAEGLEQGLALRALLSGVVALSSQRRDVADLAAELQFLAENLDDERDYSFMRP